MLKFRLPCISESRGIHYDAGRHAKDPSRPLTPFLKRGMFGVAARLEGVGANKELMH